MEPIYGSYGYTDPELKYDSDSNVSVHINNDNIVESNNTTENPMINIQRDTIDYDDLQHKYDMQPPNDSPLWVLLYYHLKLWYKNFSFIASLISLFPIIRWLPKYSVKNSLLLDIIAGFSVSILHIPQGIAYSLLAGLDAVNGLYVSFFPVIIYSLMGSSHHISIGTFAVASLMLNNAATKIGSVPNRINSTLTNIPPMEVPTLWPPTYLEALTSICLLTGLIQLSMGFLRLGILSVILSDHLVSGFSTSVSIHVATSQLNGILGLNIPNPPSGAFKLIKTWIRVGKNLPEVNVATLISSLIMLSILMIFKEWAEPKIKKKISFPIPIDLIIVLLSTLLSWILQLNKFFRINIVGEIPKGLPTPAVPRIDLFPSVLSDSLIIAIIIYAVSLSLAKLFAKKRKYPIDANQELIALGASNIFGSFFLAFPASAALSRSTLQEKIGGKTQIAGLVSSVIILFVLLLLGPLFYHLPKSALACIIIVALKSMFLQIFDVPKIWKTSKLDAISWIVTFVAVVILDIDYGLYFGIGISIIVILIRLLFPSSAVLGQLPSTELYVDLSKYRCAKEINGIKIFRYSSPIFYLNHENFVKELLNSVIPNNGVSNEEKLKMHSKPDSVIIDLSCVPFMDTSAAESMINAITLIKEHDIDVRIASCQTQVLDLFEKTQFFDSFSKQFISASVHDAVVSLRYKI